MTPSLVRHARRQYSGVNVAPAQGGFAVHLDGRPPLTPAGQPLVLPTRALARLIAAEWAAPAETIVLESMPATRLAQATLDAFPAARNDAIGCLGEFAGHDLLCYFAEHPASLVTRQEASWSPLLAWAKAELGLDFRRAAGISHCYQPPATLAAIEALASDLDDFTLAGVAAAAQLFGSAILALAVLRGRLGAAEAFATSRLDEVFQAELWGEDAGASLIARAMAMETEMLEAWFGALR